MSYIDFIFNVYSNEDSDHDFFYFDPPYLPLNKTSNFTSYTSDGFGLEDHNKLKEVCDYLHGLGVKFLMSNSSSDEIRELYKNYNVMELSAKRNINSSGDKRGNVTELLIKNYV
jgi:DNA adenine methylase